MKISTTPSTRTGAAILKVLLILGFIFLAAVAGFFYLSDSTARRELDQARAAAEESAQQLQQLQAQPAAQPKPAEDNTIELVKLRGEVAKYRAMEKQFQALQTENQQLRASLQQQQQANSEAAALRNQNTQLQQVAQDGIFTAQCVANLRSMAGAKQRWALENQKTQADMPMDTDIFGRYLPQKPVCPKGGVYVLGTVNARPTCTIPGHTY